MLPKPSGSKNALGALCCAADACPRNAVPLGALKIKFHSIAASPSTNGRAQGSNGLFIFLFKVAARLSR